MGTTTQPLTFNCCHCGKDFDVSVEVADKENSQLVDAIVYCGHCGEACRVEIYEHEVPTTNVFRGESSWTAAEIAQLKDQVFSTKPI